MQPPGPVATGPYQRRLPIVTAGIGASARGDRSAASAAAIMPRIRPLWRALWSGWRHLLRSV